MSSTAIPSRPGENNLGSDPTELFVKVFPGEVLAAYEAMNIFEPLVFTRTITHGKSAAFPVIGTATARYHTPGSRITEGTQRIRHTEKIIPIDGKLIADAFVADQDEAMIHYELRSRYARELGSALAKANDEKTAIKIIQAARAGALLTGLNGGSALTGANMDTDSDVLLAALFSAAQTLDEKDVPEYGRVAALRPAQYYLIVQNPKAINRDTGGRGVYAEGKVWKVSNLSIQKSNHIPSTNISADDALEVNDYTGNFTKTVGTVFCQDAAGIVRLMGLKMQTEDSVDLQGHLMVASMMVGRDKLRPDCAIELAKP